MKKFIVSAALGAALFAAPAWPGGSAFWQMETFNDFARGTFTGISLTRDGKLSLAPRMEEVFASDQALVWTAAQDSRGIVYLGTGHSGRVYKLDDNLKATLLFDAPEPEVFALATGRDGALYAGTSPDGKVYKIGADGKAQPFFDPQAKYIWSLAAAPDGSLYVGTGDRGRIYKVGADGKGALFFDTQQAHVMSLALASDQSVIAGSAPNGLLYRISPAAKAFVLYDAPLAEIHSVAVAPDGSVLVSAMAAGTKGTQGVVVAAGTGGAAGDTGVPTASITIQATPPTEPDPDKEKGAEPGEADKAAAAAAATAAASVPVPPMDFSLGRSAIYRVAPDHTVETLWSSRDESVYDILPAGQGNLLFSTDERGRIYELNAERQTTLLVQTNEEQTTRLLRRGAHVLAATANFGKVFKVETAPGDRGWYESPVKDTRSISQWGKLSWRAQVPDGGRVEFLVRTGNSSSPDPTWSEWQRTGKSAPAAGRRDLFDDAIQAPPARYIQWKAVFHGAGGRSPVLEDVSVAYLPQNRAPVINSVTINPAGPPMVKPPLPAGGAIATPTDPMVVIVEDTPTPGRAQMAPSNPALPAAPRSTGVPVVTINWQAEDPDSDRMVYALYLRGEGESQWRLLKDNLREAMFQIEPETLPDGKYQVRLVASDAEVNPAQSARTAEQVSAPFLVDNTPPIVRLARQERKGDSAEVRFDVSDGASVLRRAEYSLDAGPWTPIYSEDGIVDSHSEAFVIRLDKLTPGEHVVVLRVYDSGNNAGMGKAVLK